MRILGGGGHCTVAAPKSQARAERGVSTERCEEEPDSHHCARLGHGRIAVASIYGYVDDMHATYMMLEELLQNQIQKHGHIIVGGDFNVEAERMAA